VIQKEVGDGALEDHDLYPVVVLEGRDDLSHLQNEFRTHEFKGGLSRVTRLREGVVTRSSVTCAGSVAEGMTLLLLD